MSVTIFDVAKEAGVSIATVSRVLNGNGYRSPEADTRVKEAMEKLGYRPNSAARMLVSGSNSTIAFVDVGSLADPLYGKILRLLRSTLQDKGLHLLVSDWDNLLDCPVDGVLLLDNPQEWAPQVARMKKAGIAMACFGVRCANLPTTMDTVAIHSRAACDELLEQMYVQGARRVIFAHVGNCTTWRGTKDSRHVAYDAFVTRRGLTSECLRLKDQRRDIVCAAIKAFAAKNPLPDAFFCSNDETALGVTAALLQLGRRIPEDVMVSGFDGTDDTAYYTPPITTIETDWAAAIQTATELLLARRAQPTAPLARQEQDARLQIRASTQRLR